MIVSIRTAGQEDEIGAGTLRDGDGDDRSGDKNIYSRFVSARIKSNIKQEWERQKHLHGKTQEELAEHLDLSQGAVSKPLAGLSSDDWSARPHNHGDGRHQATQENYQAPTTPLQ